MSFQRCRFLIKNYTLDAASVTVTPSPISGYPATNLKLADATALCKVSGASFNAVVNLPSGPKVHALALAGLKYSTTAQIRLRGNTSNSWGSPLYDSGWMTAYPSLVAFGGGNFGDFGFGGYLTAAQAPYYRPCFVLFLPTMSEDLWWNLDISDPGAASIGLGILGLCEMVQMKRNFITGYPVTTKDSSNILTSTMGAPKAGRTGTRIDQYKLDFKNLPKEDRWLLHNTFKTLGAASPIFAVLHPADDGSDSSWTTLYCTARYGGSKITGVETNDIQLDLIEQPF